MSTRRARIKAVASLPIRKRSVVINSKNNNENEESQESEKQKQTTEMSSPKNSLHIPETSSKSPRKSKSPSINEENEIKNSNSNINNSNVNQGINHRRRTMKPPINIARSNKRKDLDDGNSDSHAIQSKKSKSDEIKDNTSESNSSKDLLKPQDVNSVDDIDKNKIVSIDGIIPLTSSLREEISNVSLSNKNDSIESSILGTDINFDPIIPLPSPCKNRPKLKPMPRFSLRRNSFQGSASESEDDIKKNKREESIAPVFVNTPIQTIPPIISNRIRNDSVCSLPADPNLHINFPITPRQKPNRNRSTVGGEGRRAAAKKRALSKHPQNPLTMCDLIYYNPPNNNKKPNEIKKNEKPLFVDEKEVNTISTVEIKDTASRDSEDTGEKSNSMPVPQVKLGPNGEIVIDEQSLVIETTDATRSREEISKLSVVYENGFGSSSGLYRRNMRTREWTNAETLRFYKALNTIGTDFALMLTLFPGRTRKDLKVKFKKEEKNNLALVDKALMNPLHFDISELQQQLEEEQKIVDPKVKKLPRNKSKPNYNRSSAALRSMMDPTEAEKSSGYHKRKKITFEHEEKSSDKTKKSVDSETKNTDNSDQELNIPKNVEPGSMVILVKKIPGTKNRNTLQAYLSENVDNESRLVPFNLEIDLLKSLAKNMNILKPGQEYEAASEIPSTIVTGILSRDDEDFENVDNSDILDIDDNILNDSSIDNYILTGKTNLSNNTLSSPIINL